ncbi:MAG TPA: DoxX family protein [Tepidisphaeraceae bacterium]|nr:DoxX family protein [Tepidisphaeraceae bacterium]
MSAIHPAEYSPASPDRRLAASATWLAVPGRVLMSIIFLLSGFMKFSHLNAMASAVHMPPALLGLAATVEVVGGLSLLLGVWSRWGAILLFLFLIPTTFMFHNFWAAPAAQQQDQMAHFLKNLAIMGGLLAIAAYGAGPLSVDAATRRPRVGADIHPA